MLRQEIARVEEMIDEKLAEFKIALLAELKPKPITINTALIPEAKVQPKAKVEEKKK